MNRSRQSQSGFSMLGMLLALVIIAILTGYYFSGGDNASPVDYYKQSSEAAGMYPMAKGRAEAAVGDVNIAQFETQIATWAMNHPGQKVTIADLQREGYQIPQAPAGKHWEIDEANHPVLVEDQGSLTPGGVPAPNLP